MLEQAMRKKWKIFVSPCLKSFLSTATLRKSTKSGTQKTLWIDAQTSGLLFFINFPTYGNDLSWKNYIKKSTIDNSTTVCQTCLTFFFLWMFEKSTVFGICGAPHQKQENVKSGNVHSTLSVWVEFNLFIPFLILKACLQIIEKMY